MIETKNNFIKFKVEWRINPPEELGDLNLDIDPILEEGVIYWRKDMILGFNNAEKEDETFLIIGFDDKQIRENFRVKESIDEVAKKLNG